MSKNTMATAIPDKGGGNRFAVDQCIEFLEDNGDRENIVFCEKKWMEMGGGNAITHTHTNTPQFLDLDYDN